MIWLPCWLCRSLRLSATLLLQVIEQALIPLQVYTAKHLTADLTVTDVAPYPIVDAREDTLKSLFNFVEYSRSTTSAA